MDLHQAFSLLAFWLLGFLTNMRFDYPTVKQMKWKLTSSKPRIQTHRAYLELHKTPPQPKLDVLPPELIQIINSLVRGRSG